MASVFVARPGMQTTVQDLGRWGWQAMGVPVAGVMDRDSCRIANALAGNRSGAAVLEVAFIGPELEFEEARTVAIAGADFEILMNEQAVAIDSRVTVPAGGRLKFGRRRRGSRAYIAINGGIDVPVVLGSRSTHLSSGMGGFQGRALLAGDRVPLLDGAPSEVPQASPQADRLIRSDGAYVLRVIPDARTERFAPDAFDVLQASEYAIGSSSNRMGYRLEGAPVGLAHGVDVPSDVTPMGTIQVPGSGQPILLMADRQTTGGYPPIGTVITADLPIAAQLGPGDRIRFRICATADARQALLEREQVVHQWEGAGPA